MKPTPHFLLLLRQLTWALLLVQYATVYCQGYWLLYTVLVLEPFSSLYHHSDRCKRQYVYVPHSTLQWLEKQSNDISVNVKTCLCVEMFDEIETVSIDTEIITFSATDADQPGTNNSRVFYYIDQRDDNGLFALNSATV